MIEQIARTPERVCVTPEGDMCVYVCVIETQTDRLAGGKSGKRRSHYPIWISISLLPAFCPYSTPMNIPLIKQLDWETKHWLQKHYSCLAVTYLPLFHCIFHIDKVFNYVITCVHIKHLYKATQNWPDNALTAHATVDRTSSEVSYVWNFV